MATTATMFPRGGWDVHHHIFDPSLFPYAADRHLTPPPATVAQYRAFKSKIGATHSVLTHGLSYGDDCTSLISFLRDLGSNQTRGIAVIDAVQTSDATVQALHDAGVRGIRINLYALNAMHSLPLQQRALAEHARRISAFPGWSITFTHTHPEHWDALRPTIEMHLQPFGIKLVTDHFALLKGASLLPARYLNDIIQQPGFEAITTLLRDGLLYVKLSAPYRVSDMAPDYPDLEPLVKALVKANPRRVLWGSDWPHTPRMRVRDRTEADREEPFLDVDDQAWLANLRSWVSEEEWDLIVRVNPAELYGGV